MVASVVYPIKPGHCACGRPLHYLNSLNEAAMNRAIKEAGDEFVPVKVVGGKTYRVQRHYIALHGLNARELPSLGFREVKR